MTKEQKFNLWCSFVAANATGFMPLTTELIRGGFSDRQVNEKFVVTCCVMADMLLEAAERREKTFE